jgi:hypothetical protein
VHLDATLGINVAGWWYDNGEPNQAHLHDELRRIPTASELEVHDGGEMQQGIVTQMLDLHVDTS